MKTHSKTNRSAILALTFVVACFGQVQALEAPVLVWPHNAMRNIDFQFNFPRWNAVAGASEYRVQFSTDSTFAGSIAIDQIVPDTNIYPQGLAGYIRYYWRVAAQDSSGTSAWSELRWFSRTQDNTAPPGLFYPENKAEDINSSYRFEWSTTHGNHRYRLQISHDSLFSANTLREIDARYALEDVHGLHYSTRYFWRVQDQWNMLWSPTWSFTTRNPPPAPTTAPLLLSLDNEYCMPLSWQSVLDARTYRLQISNDSGFTAIIHENDSIKTATSTAIYRWYGADSARYFWRVRAENDSGVGPFSPVRSFITCRVVSVTRGFSKDASTNDVFKLRGNRVIFRLAEPSKIRIRAINSLGKELKVWPTAHSQPGQHSVVLPDNLTGLFFLDVQLGPSRYIFKLFR